MPVHRVIRVITSLAAENAFEDLIAHRQISLSSIYRNNDGHDGVSSPVPLPRPPKKKSQAKVTPDCSMTKTLLAAGREAKLV